MQFERVSKSNVPPSTNQRGKYRALWAALEALGDTGDVIAVRDMSPSDVQKFRSAARMGNRRNLNYRVATRFISGVLYVSRVNATPEAPAVVREFAAVR